MRIFLLSPPGFEAETLSLTDKLPSYETNNIYELKFFVIFT